MYQEKRAAFEAVLTERLHKVAVLSALLEGLIPPDKSTGAFALYQDHAVMQVVLK